MQLCERRKFRTIYNDRVSQAKNLHYIKFCQKLGYTSSQTVDMIHNDDCMSNAQLKDDLEMSNENISRILKIWKWVACKIHFTSAQSKVARKKELLLAMKYGFMATPLKQKHNRWWEKSLDRGLDPRKLTRVGAMWKQCSLFSLIIKILYTTNMLYKVVINIEYYLSF